VNTSGAINRRDFFAVGSMVATSAAIAQRLQSSPAGHSDAELFKTINFTSDGLGLDPREYVALLSQLIARRAVPADYYSNGGMVEEVEQKFARLLGKQRAIFLPTGTLANHMAVRKLAGTDRRVLVQAESHFYNDEGDCAEVLSGINVIPLAPGSTTMTLDEIKYWIDRSASGRVVMKVGVISIESPVRHKDHAAFDFGEMQHISQYARQHGIRLHLDGARMFTLPYHSGKSVQDYAALFDTVYVSLWKHFNGACGAILAGDATVIDGLFHTRRMFGGSLPQAWPGIALVAETADHFQDDYAKSWQAADAFLRLLAPEGRFKVQKVTDGTSRFLLGASGISPEALVKNLRQRGVVVSGTPSANGMFPMQVNATILRTTPAKLATTFRDALNG
jgi:threonine aldolase